jgi:hypothetical protein
MSDCRRLAKIRHREGNQMAEKCVVDSLKLVIRN